MLNAMGLLVLVLGAGAPAEDAADPMARILEELKKLSDRLEAIENRLGALEAAVREGTLKREEAKAADEPERLKRLLRSRSKLEGFSRRAHTLEGLSDERREADPAALRQIKLPESPTREDVKEYVRKIVVESRKQNTFSSMDPQIGMLKKVGREHLDVLLEAWRDSDPLMLDMYFVSAVGRLAGEEDKAKVIAALEECGPVVKVIIEKGWEQDARKELVEGLRARRQDLPTEWIQSVASFRDPETYPDLVEHFADEMFPRRTYEAIKDLPGLDIDTAVKRVWEERLRGDFSKFREEELAPIAAVHGHSDALEMVFNELLEADGDWRREILRKAITKATAARGTDEELVAWYVSNRTSLAWDPEKRMFVAAEEEREQQKETRKQTKKKAEPAAPNGKEATKTEPEAKPLPGPESPPGG